MNDETPFGEHPAGRFGADVEYRGRADGYDYVVQVRHHLLDTSFTVEIDGVPHDPVAEQKAEKTAQKLAAVAGASATDDWTPPADGLRFRVEDGFTTLRCTVRRERESDAEAEGVETASVEAGGAEADDAEAGDIGASDVGARGVDACDEVADAEVLIIRTAGLGGAGEGEGRHGLTTTVLAPAAGTPSASRDERRTPHPPRYALIAALTTSAKFLIPLLGLGALLSGVLDPLKERVEARIRPVVEAVAAATAPVRQWLSDLIRPVADFLDTLLQPLRDLVRWLIGLLPDVSLPFGVPDWLADVLAPVMVVLGAFLATRSALQRRREQLEGDASSESDADSARQPSARPTGEARNASRSAGESSTQN